MDMTNHLLFLGGLLIFISVLASTISARFGLPLLLVFLGVGMAAGPEGPGGIQFNDFPRAFFIGNLALAVILLDGGLRTRMHTFRVALKPALSLATLGVVVTAGAVGLFACLLLDFDWRYGLLLGAIVGSTDAAAVFSLLRQSGINLNERVGATLEIESGANDPMAIFLVMTLVAMLSGETAPGPGNLLLNFAQQFSVGIAGGVAGGWLLAQLLRRVQLAEGLYALLIVSGGLILFSLVNNLGGSGFLAIYLCGLMVGNSKSHATDHVLKVMDGLAWLAQAGMFLILGFLVTPTRLFADALPSLLIGLFIIVAARPLAVFIGLLPFKFPKREQLFVSWVGLRGAVPIVLAVFPLLAGLPHSETIFSITCSVVVMSMLIQGSSLPWMARLLRVEVPADPAPLDLRQVLATDHQQFALMQFRVAAEAPVIGYGFDILKPPGDDHPPLRGVAVVREGRLLFADQQPLLQAGDGVVVLAPEDDGARLAQLFVDHPTTGSLAENQFFGEFVVSGDVLAGDLAAVYGLELPPGLGEQSLAALICTSLNRAPIVGERVRVGVVLLTVRSMAAGAIDQVGLKVVA
ncbi:MAG: potassium/proton antiporter [Gammaproteobacteria bacterium]|nr:potassium/proton antiporter [Gammaproteobacteria bacterium]